LRVAQRILASGIDGFVTTDRLLVNGVAVDPAPGASIVVFTQVNKIVSSNAAMIVGGIPLQNKRDFGLDTRPLSGGEIPLGPIARVPSPRTLGELALPLRADVDLTLLPGTPEQPGGTRITTSLKLPAIFNLGLGAGAQADVTLRVTPTGELELDDMRVALPSVSIGVMQLSDLELAFRRENGDSVGEGHAVVCILEAGVSAGAPNGGVWIRNGNSSARSSTSTSTRRSRPTTTSTSPTSAPRAKGTCSSRCSIRTSSSATATSSTSSPAMSTSAVRSARRSAASSPSRGARAASSTSPTASSTSARTSRCASSSSTSAAP
jgi:hypothetical protein